MEYLLFLSTSLAHLWLDSPRSTNHDTAGSVLLLERTDLNQSATARVILPGLVYIAQAVPMAIQKKVVAQVLRHGHKSLKMWKQDEGEKAGYWELNNLRQGRGRIYDALDSYADCDYLKQLCDVLAEWAREVDPTMPPMTPTHLLSMYYTTTRKLGWHSDNGPQDGSSLQPVVSVSFGNDCSFLLREKRDGEPIQIRLKSGDAILFGGQSRWILHTVDTIDPGTAPAELCQLHQRIARDYAPSPSISYTGQKNPTKGWQPPSGCFRLNLTFRNAPELRGRENEDKFFYFARSARKFAEACQSDGVESARRAVVERRRKKAEERQKKKDARAKERERGKRS